MHTARAGMRFIGPGAKAYSEAWLAERRRIAAAVGIAVVSSSPRRGFAVAQAMHEAVMESIKAGIDIDTEAAEVRRRMMIARDKA